MEKKNILLTNDDGFDSKLFQTFSKLLSKNNNVYIIAPVKNVSQMSNAVSNEKRLYFEKITKNEYKVYGYTADCVAFGCISEIFPSIDLVISGINFGRNIGLDVKYSSTVAGAREGAVYGKVGIAISLWGNSNISIEEASKLACKLIESNFYKSNYGSFYNINIPDCNVENIKGVIWTRLERIRYKTQCNCHIEGENNSWLEFNTEGIEKTSFSKDTDLYAIENEWISISPLTLDETDFSMKSKWNNI